jgi:hypothetical protein
MSTTSVEPEASQPLPSNPPSTGASNPNGPPPPSFDSAIISDFPDIFSEFRQKNQISLLWRGNRDGFSAEEFRRRCDGHANTLIVILDTNGNIFGGFTPVKWTFPDNATYLYKTDDSLKSFLFTLKNPHNVPPEDLL